MITTSANLARDTSAAVSGRVLVTGSTGFIGHHILAELLTRHVPCAALLRQDLPASTRRLSDLLADLDVDLEQHVAHGNLLLLEGDLNGTLPRAFGAGLGALLHVAASTDFDRNGAGDPWRTNVEGTRRLLEWAEARDIRSIHLVSSAFRCGVPVGPVAETVGATGDMTGESTEPTFHNEYERSKWRAEADAAAWAAQHDATLTIYRPSIVVGHRATGRTTSFGGFYVMARAGEVLARHYAPDEPGRRQTGIRVVGRADAVQDIVPVDYVAGLVAHAVTHPASHGRVYHLTHPQPPTNALLKRAIDEHFDLAGSDFVDPEDVEAASLTDVERLFYDASRPVRPYIVDTPRFERDNAAILERDAGVHCPAYEMSELRRLIAYAETARWGRRRRRTRSRIEADDTLIVEYFERYLPRCLAVSRVARMTALTTTMRFVLSDVPDGQWWCRFVDGVLVQTKRGADLGAREREDFTYTTTRDVFWSAVAGAVDPQRVFLQDQAQVSGDIEAALKMAMILHQFNREFPCTPQTLSTEETWVCPATA